MGNRRALLTDRREGVTMKLLWARFSAGHNEGVSFSAPPRSGLVFVMS